MCCRSAAFEKILFKRRFIGVKSFEPKANNSFEAGGIGWAVPLKYETFIDFSNLMKLGIGLANTDSHTFLTWSEIKILSFFIDRKTHTNGSQFIYSADALSY